MKIAFLFTNFPTDGQTSNVSRITSLIDKGHDVRIFALSPQKSLKRIHENILEYGLIEKTTYYHSGENLLTILTSILKDFFQNPIATMQRIGNARIYDRTRIADEQYDHMKKESFLEKNLIAFFRRSFCKAYFMQKSFATLHQFDIINVFNGPVAVKMLFIKKMFPEIKYVVSFVGFDFSSRIRFHGTKYYNELFETADLIMTKSNYSRDCLIELGCPEEKVIVHPNGIYLDDFHYNPRIVDKQKQMINFVIVARLVEKKSHRVLLCAFSKLAKKYPHVALHVAGDSPSDENIRREKKHEYDIRQSEYIAGGNTLHEKITAQINNDPILKKYVVMHGKLTRNDVIRLLEKCHVFILPSVTTLRWAEQEDTPTALLEAQAMGLPVISTYHAGIPEVVRNNETGFLVPERNENELFSAMEKFVKKPDLIFKLGQRGRAFLEEKHDIKNLNNHLETIFRNLCGSKETLDNLLYHEN